MFAELLTRGAYRVLDGVGPDGASYWSQRYWDRGVFQEHPVVGSHYRRQDQNIAELIAKYGVAADSVVEIACGTGVFTAFACRLTRPARIVALDISPHALAVVRGVVTDDRLELRNADFWLDDGVEPADLVLCMDAIHHLGSAPDVLRRLRHYLRPGGVLIGNVWTLDNYHEFQRSRIGPWKHFRQTAAFALTALLIRVSGGRLRTTSYRTQLRYSVEFRELLEANVGQVLELQVDRYFTAFACRA